MQAETLTLSLFRRDLGAESPLILVRSRQAQSVTTRLIARSLRIAELLTLLPSLPLTSLLSLQARRVASTLTLLLIY